MPHWNLPDDWNSYWSTCSVCGRRYHLSGTDDCACVLCERCQDKVSPEDVETIAGLAYCPGCADRERNPEDYEEVDDGE